MKHKQIKKEGSCELHNTKKLLWFKRLTVVVNLQLSTREKILIDNCKINLCKKYNVKHYMSRK